MPINLNLKGKMIAYLRFELKPKEIGLVPDELCFDGEIEFHERTIVFHWMKQWLKWVQWYYTDAWSPEVSIDQMFSAPMCAGKDSILMRISSSLVFSGSCTTWLLAGVCRLHLIGC